MKTFDRKPQSVVRAIVTMDGALASYTTASVNRAVSTIRNHHHHHHHYRRRRRRRQQQR